MDGIGNNHGATGSADAMPVPASPTAGGSVQVELALVKEEMDKLKKDLAEANDIIRALVTSQSSTTTSSPPPGVSMSPTYSSPKNDLFLKPIDVKDVKKPFQM